MPLEFPEPETYVPPQDPNPLAHQASEEADYAIDAANSFEAYKLRVQKKRSKPTQQKLENVPTNLVTIACALSIVYLLVVFIEWRISREIYEVIWPDLPHAIYAFCVGFCFWISICFGETSRHFSLELNNRKRDSSAAKAVSTVISKQYDQSQGPRPSATGNWYISVTTGCIAAFVFLYGIYALSDDRVTLRQQAGESAGTMFELLLPDALFICEIVLGIPTYFFMAWLCNLVRVRSSTNKLTERRYNALKLRRSALQKFQQYENARQTYNDWARKNQEPMKAELPATNALRQLFREDYTSTDDEETAMPEREIPPNTPPPDAAYAAQKAESEEEVGGDRTEDLLNLIDDQINNLNESKPIT